MKSRYAILVALLFVLVLTGCPRKETTTTDTGTTAGTTSATDTGTSVAPEEPPKIEATPEAVEAATAELAQLANRDRRMHAALTFEEFKNQVYKEPWEGGKYIVNGDTPLFNEKALQDFYDQNVKSRPPTELIVHQVNGIDSKWDAQQKIKLTYCVSNTFGARHASVVQQMASATSVWEQSAAVDFIHDATQDGNCVASNTAVVFDVRPVNVNSQYLARAFFPNEPRSECNVLIDESSFNLAPGGKLQLAGILRHELGHTIGFRHEHTRPQSGTCFEDNDWRPLTGYDAFSVMHYPQCNGMGDWSLTLTTKDRNGVACLYGPAQGFTIDPAQVANAATCAAAQPQVTGQPQTQTFAAQSVAKDAQKPYGPFAVAAGSQFVAKIGGANASGDPDLYVRFGANPTTRLYDCRPFVDGPVEVCTLTVPAGTTQAHVMVRGYKAGAYDVTVTRVPPAP